MRFGTSFKKKLTQASFHAWACEVQPSALGVAADADSFADGNWDANEIIENLFEPLREAYPTYITRELIGKDASDTYDMWKYEFTPENYEQTIYIQSGVHSREKAALLGLARFLKLVCEQDGSNADMDYLRNNVRLIVVPIVNPWGISQENPDSFATTAARDGNCNGVNLNRDFSSTTPQQETQNVIAVLEAYKDDLSCAIDYHSTVNASYGDYAVRWSSDAQPNIEISNEIVNYLAEKNVIGREPDLHYHGRSDTDGTSIWYFWNKLNVPGCTVEHADYVWDTSSKYSAVVMTRSVELIGNVVLNYARQQFKLQK